MSLSSFLNQTPPLLVNPSFLAPLLHGIHFRNRSGISLTFDDGPHPEYTPAVLRICSQRKIPAAFFLTGEKAARHADLTNAIRNAGHQIGNHGFSHRRLTFCSGAVIRREIDEGNNILEEICGSRPLFFRPPYGRFDFRLRPLLTARGQIMVLWSLLSYDFRAHTAGEIIRLVEKYLHPGAVIVLHDGHPRAGMMLQALPVILDMIEKRGYTFAPLDPDTCSNPTFCQFPSPDGS